MKSEAAQRVVLVLLGVGLLPGCGRPSTHHLGCNSDAECGPGNLCSAGKCIAGNNPETPPQEGGGLESRCASADDCSEDLHCNVQTGACQACLHDAHCANGESCVEGTCSVTAGCPDGSCEVACTSQADCDPYGKICDLAAAHCVDCVADVQCGSGKQCTAGTCRATGEGCQSAVDCPAGLICTSEGVCGPCSRDNECPGQRCDPTTGRCVEPECSDNAGCANGWVCSSGVCAPCQEDTECDPGYFCNVAQQCETTAGPSCYSNADCWDGKVCRNHQCVPCQSSDECNPSDRCEDGMCVPEGWEDPEDPVDPEDPAPPTEQPSSLTMGDRCDGSVPCGRGLICLGNSTLALCTRTCIGSGRTGNADCPPGWACLASENGPTDGLRLCLRSDQLAADLPGQPFSTPPGGACSQENNTCQTGLCDVNSGSCARACMANRDCGTGETCWARWEDLGDGAYEWLGGHMCVASDLSTYKATGAACASSPECDSGICAGVCADGVNPCNLSQDCPGGGQCLGRCVDHCRSNSDCPQGQCSPWPMHIRGGSYSAWTQSCFAKSHRGEEPLGASCDSHDVCAGEWCIEGSCTTPCAIDEDCSAGRTCTPFFFTEAAYPLRALAFCLESPAG